ncbi:MAG: hypothetical protein ACKVQU_24665 [Burkholderiales bacterium]
MFRTLIVAVGLALALPVLAQSNNSVEGKRPARVAMAEKLGLSAPQAERMKSIMKASRQQSIAFKTELQKTQDRKAKRAIREKMQASKGEARKQLSQVLTADQMRKYDALRPTPPRRVPAKSA